MARGKERNVFKDIFRKEAGEQEEAGGKVNGIIICTDHIAKDVGKKRWEEGLPSALCAAAGGCWTGQRQQKAGYIGPMGDRLCPRCGLEDDTLHHRLWLCRVT